MIGNAEFYCMDGIYFKWALLNLEHISNGQRFYWNIPVVLRANIQFAGNSTCCKFIHATVEFICPQNKRPRRPRDPISPIVITLRVFENFLENFKVIFQNLRHSLNLWSVIFNCCSMFDTTTTLSNSLNRWHRRLLTMGIPIGSLAQMS